MGRSGKSSDCAERPVFLMDAFELPMIAALRSEFYGDMVENSQKIDTQII